VLFLLFFFSGASALIYEVVWVRVFANVFGNTIYTAAALLAFAVTTNFTVGLFCLAVAGSSFTVSCLSELELGPTIILNNPGSTTRRISSLRNESLSGVMTN